MPQSLSPSTIALVKASIPALAEHGSSITRAMYERLFQHEHIRALFNHSNQGDSGAQVHALAAAILAYAHNVENLAALAPAVERIAYKHIGYHILPEHYPFVADALLGALREVLGSAASEELITAWREAYWLLADLLKAREMELRQTLLRAEGGWAGWRRFVVAEKIRESSVITSFVLRPEDGQPVLRHRPGQYLTFQLRPTGSPELRRNYSISCGPNNETYQISIKREDGGNGGSRFFHDVIQTGSIVEATPPAGDFVLNETPRHPVILLSGGVGLTPMVSMLEHIAADHPGLETHFVHGALNSQTHAMDRRVRALARTHGRTAVTTFYSEPAADDAVGKTHDANGFITTAWLESATPLRAAEIYLCGPKPFLRNMVRGLRDAGVSPALIHYEFFGPADELLAA